MTAARDSVKLSLLGVTLVGVVGLQVSGVPASRLGALQQPPAAPPPVVGTGAISGVVLDGTTNSPIAGAVVYLGPPNQQTGQPRRLLTDEKGRFVFMHLGPVREGYSLGATKAGYLSGSFGQAAGGASRIFLGDGEWFASAKIVLYRPSAIAGTITDEEGDPLVGAYVRVLTEVVVAGVPHLAAGPAAKTDDRGAYRIGGLTPGRYVVHVPSVQVGVSAAAAAAPLSVLAASPEPTLEIDLATRLVLGRYPMPRPSPDGRLRVYAPTFFPGVRSLADAQTIDLERGEDRQGVDLRLLPVSAVLVSGTVVGPGEALTGLRLRLLAAGMEALGDGSETATTMVGGDGSFTFGNVPAGQYTIVARWVAAEFVARTAVLVPMTELPMAPNSLTISTSGAPDEAGTTYRELDRKVSAAYWGRTRVDVGDRDVTGIVVTMQRGVTISGRGVWDGTPGGGALLQQPPGLAIRVQAEPANGDISLAGPSQYRGRPDDPAAFIFEGLPPGQFFVRATLGPQIRSIEWNGRDMTHRPFDTSDGRDFADVVITLTDKTAILTGTVLDERGLPAANAMVIAFPVEREQWTHYGFTAPRLRAARTASNGTFRQTNLPAGEYFVAAIRVDQSADWRRAKFLEAASALATRVTLDWADTSNVGVKLVQVPVK